MNNCIPIIKLNDGNCIPQLGIGMYVMYEKDKCIASIREALRLGIRHIDTAVFYKNEKFVGEAIKNCGVNREEIFITTKIWLDQYGEKKTAKAIEECLKNLDVDYIDLVLLHQQVNDYIGAWKVLEKYKDAGKIKSIGLSNFDESGINEILNIAKYKPVVNQIEAHPYNHNSKIAEVMKKNDIKFEAWYPLGHGDKKLLKEQIFEELSKKYNKTPAQIILRWHIQKEHIIFPKASNLNHIRENVDIFDFEISQEDMDKIDSLNKEKSYLFIPVPLYRFIMKFIKHIRLH